MSNTVLVALDGSECAEHALREACEILQAQGGDMHLVHVSQFQPLVLGSASVMSVQPREELEAVGKKLLDSAAQHASDAGVNLSELHNIVGEKSPARAILQVADDIEADLIVLGSVGHSDLSGLLLGSVSHQVCHHAKCSCLIVR